MCFVNPKVSTFYFIITFYICLHTAVIIGAIISVILLFLVILIVAIICVILWMKKKGVLSVTCTVYQKIEI